MTLGKHHLLRVAVSLVSGLGVLGLIALVTRTPEGNSRGFPLMWSAPVTPCPTPNSINGCGFVYSIPMLVLDYTLWAAITFGLLLVVGFLRGRTSKVAAAEE